MGIADGNHSIMIVYSGPGLGLGDLQWHFNIQDPYGNNI